MYKFGYVVGVTWSLVTWLEKILVYDGLEGFMGDTYGSYTMVFAIEGEETGLLFIFLFLLLSISIVLPCGASVVMANNNYLIQHCSFVTVFGTCACKNPRMKCSCSSTCARF